MESDQLDEGDLGHDNFSMPPWAFLETRPQRQMLEAADGQNKDSAQSVFIIFHVFLVCLLGWQWNSRCISFSLLQ